MFLMCMIFISTCKGMAMWWKTEDCHLLACWSCF